MPVFEYKGLNEAGKAVSGMLEAESPKGLRGALRKDGIYLTDVLAQRDGGPARGGPRGAAKAAATLASTDVDFRRLTRGRVTTDDIAITTRQLATLLGAGVTLVEALTALVDSPKRPASSGCSRT